MHYAFKLRQTQPWGFNKEMEVRKRNFIHYELGINQLSINQGLPPHCL